jgi:hypothetical protein
MTCFVDLSDHKSTVQVSMLFTRLYQTATGRLDLVFANIVNPPGSGDLRTPGARFYF